MQCCLDAVERQHTNQEQIYHMRINRIWMAALLLLPAAGQAHEVAWYAGGHVTYSVQKSHGTVVGKALEMFRADMRAVTGCTAPRGR